MAEPMPVIPLEYAPVSPEVRGGKVLRVLVPIAWLACLIAWGLLFVEVETVLVTGPIIALFGLGMLVGGLRWRSSIHVVLGTMHCAICLLFFMLVLRGRWTPDQSFKPFTAMGGAYLLLSGVAGLWVRFGRR
jgi:hypothetical protein